MGKIIIVALSVIGMSWVAWAIAHEPMRTTQFRPCVWPNTCVSTVA